MPIIFDITYNDFTQPNCYASESELVEMEILLGSLRAVLAEKVKLDQL